MTIYEVTMNYQLMHGQCTKGRVLLKSQPDSVYSNHINLIWYLAINDFCIYYMCNDILLKNLNIKAIYILNVMLEWSVNEGRKCIHCRVNVYIACMNSEKDKSQWSKHTHIILRWQYPFNIYIWLCHWKRCQLN